MQESETVLEDSALATCRLILGAVSVLHERGYGELRVSLGLSPSGLHLRIWLLPKSFTSGHDGITPIWMGGCEPDMEYAEVCLGHTTGNVTMPFAWEDAVTVSPSRLADLILDRAPQLCQMCDGQDPEYADWLDHVHRESSRGFLPSAFDDYNACGLGELKTLSFLSNGSIPSAIKLPPPGSGSISNPSVVECINGLRSNLSTEERSLADNIWLHRQYFVRWPTEDVLLLPNCTRKKYHKYSDDLKSKLAARKVKADTRSNGPAIAAYLYAGGKRPIKLNKKHGWSIHHIYDGQFPLFDSDDVPRAVELGELFTRTSGLVAIHPVADAMASEFPYLAWLLRAEAYRRFGLDPCNVLHEM